MIITKRSPENPVFLPDRENAWEAEAAFNGSILKEGKTFHLVYRAVAEAQAYKGVNIELSTVGHAQSRDGVHFRGREQLVKPEYEWEQFGCEDPRVTKLGGKYYIFYTALSTYPFTAEGIKVGVMVTKSLRRSGTKHLVTPFNAKAMALFPQKVNGKMVAVLTANTDKPPSKIGIAFFDKEEDMWSRKYWEKWYGALNAHTLPLQRTSNDQIEIGAPPIKTKYGWLLIYSYIQNYFTRSSRVFGIEAALLDLKDPSRLVARTFKPLLTPDEEYEEYGRVPKVIFPSGALLSGNKLSIYYGAADTTCCLATLSFKDVVERIFKGQMYAARLERFCGNPVLEPRHDHAWEAKATFNPAALSEKGKIHLLYRAMSEDNTSALGYASSGDGFTIRERLDDPAYVPREDFEAKKQPGGNSGCEDPRLTKIGKTIYMCYTAFDGVNPPRVALTSIGASDFFAKRWRWEKPVLISPPGIDDKDACVFPEKVRGKYMFVHRIGSNIWVDLVENLDELGKSKWLGGEVLLKPRKGTWDSKKIGLAAPPIKTKKGWLLLYHGVSETSSKYRLGAALLDSRTPTKVLSQTDYPILEPEMQYEREGQFPNVVFPCGAVVQGEKLLVYYGGGDKVVGVAFIKLRTLLKELSRKRRNRVRL